MYLKYVNILYFIILTCLCLRICALEFGMEQYRLYIYRGSKDCIIPLPPLDNEMPMIYDPETNLTVYPNRQGHIVLKHNMSLRMSCVGNHFVSPINNPDISEIAINCINRHKIQYNGIDYSFEQFRCQSVPMSSMTLVNETCEEQDVNSQVMNIGFQTKNKHIILYRICFHMVTKSATYAWYYVNTPKYRYVQNSTTKPNFIQTESFGTIDVDRAYENQQPTMQKIMSSEKLAKWYVQFEETKEFEGIRYLLKAPLLTKADFIYTYEQNALYYNENTAPQWLIFSEGPKRDIEKYFKRFLLRQSTRHLVVAGTFMVSSPLNFKLKRCPLYLSLPKAIPVPEFLWKMDYNLETKKGMVFLGYNGPFKAYETIKQACATTPCPNRFRRKFYVKDLFYCCTKESFEDAFGKLSPILFEDYNN